MPVRSLTQGTYRFDAEEDSLAVSLLVEGLHH
jgi:hypothetical protein